MTNRIDTLIHRATALALAAAVTLVMLGSVNSLASRDNAPDALLARHAESLTV